MDTGFQVRTPSIARCWRWRPIGMALALATGLLGSGWPLTAAGSGVDVMPPRRLLEVVEFGPPVVSPDGRRVAFRTEQPSVERNAWDTAWYVQDLAGGLPRRVSSGGVPLRNSAGASIPVSAVWSADGAWIYFLSSLDGRTDVWRAATDGSHSGPVTHDPADVLEFRLGSDGRGLVYRVGATREHVEDAEQDEYDHGIRIGAETPIGQNLFRGLDIGGRWATQRYTGTAFGFEPLLADADRRWKSVSLDSLEVRDLPGPPDAGVAEAMEALSGRSPRPWRAEAEPGGKRIALLTRTGSAEGLLQPPDVQLSMLPDRSAGSPIACEADACTGKPITRVQWRPGSDELLFTITDPDTGLGQSIFGWNVRTNGVRHVVTARGLLNAGDIDGGSPCGVSATALVCVAAEADGPPRLERIELDTGDRHVLYAPNQALATDLARVAPSRLLRWIDGEGNPRSGHLFEAPGASRGAVPLFVTYYYCAGFMRGGTGDEWPLASLATHGISSLCINAPRGYLLDAVERYDHAVLAVESAVDLLAAQGKVDRSRVGMGGLSFGSEATLWTAMRSDILAAASVASPSIEPNYFLLLSLRDEGLFDIVKRNWGLGSTDETPGRWKTLSPIHHLDSIREPILFQMAEQEYVFGLGTVLPLVRRSQADLYVFPHETHVKHQPRHKLAVYERNLDWFRFWLLDREDAHPDRAKREQYAHWRRMKDVLASRDRTAQASTP